jgi:hypothetical protein
MGVEGAMVVTINTNTTFIPNETIGIPKLLDEIDSILGVEKTNVVV